MLVLSRLQGQKIVIGDGITVEVVEIRGDKVRLGCVAPKEVPIHRLEVWEVIHGQKKTTGEESPQPLAETVREA